MIFLTLVPLYSDQFTSNTIKIFWQRQLTHLGNNLHGDCAGIQPPDGSNGTCVFGDQCSKVTCTSPPDSTGPFGHMVMTVQAYGCHQPLRTTVTMETFRTPMKWSHTFKDGEQSPLPIPVPAGPVNVTVFLLVELKKAGGKIHFKVLRKTYHYIREDLCVLTSISLLLSQLLSFQSLIAIKGYSDWLYALYSVQVN